MSDNSFKIKKGLTLIPVDPSTLVNPEIGDLVIDSTDDNKLKKYNGSSFKEQYPSQAVAIIEDIQTQGTQSGTFTSGGYVTRILNTLSGDTTEVGVTLSSSKFTLTPGRFKIEWSAPAFDVDEHQTALYNHTDVEYAKVGTIGNAGGVDTNDYSRGVHVITLTQNTEFSISHTCTTTKSDNGYGENASLGFDNVFTQVIVTRLAL